MDMINHEENIQSSKVCKNYSLDNIFPFQHIAFHHVSPQAKPLNYVTKFILKLLLPNFCWWLMKSNSYLNNILGVGMCLLKGFFYKVMFCTFVSLQTLRNIQRHVQRSYINTIMHTHTCTHLSDKHLSHQHHCAWHFTGKSSIFKPLPLIIILNHTTNHNPPSLSPAS